MRFVLKTSGPKQTHPKQSQIDRFREAARDLECDEDEANFKEKLGTIARQAPKDDPEPTKKRGK
jgi:hypothetical protein